MNELEADWALRTHSGWLNYHISATWNSGDELLRFMHKTLNIE